MEQDADCQDPWVKVCQRRRKGLVFIQFQLFDSFCSFTRPRPQDVWIFFVYRKCAFAPEYFYPLRLPDCKPKSHHFLSNISPAPSFGSLSQYRCCELSEPVLDFRIREGLFEKSLWLKQKVYVLKRIGYMRGRLGPNYLPGVLSWATHLRLVHWDLM